MGTAVAEAPVVPTGPVDAPTGAHFENEEVKTAKGQQSLGEVPILVWDDIEAARAFYGDEGIKNVLDGTSLRVSFQSIARRYRMAKKSDNDIKKAQVEFRPGSRQGGVSTPVSRARRKAESAAEKLSNPDALSAFLEKVASGEISEADLVALSGGQS